MQELKAEQIAEYAQALQEELEESQTSIYATNLKRAFIQDMVVNKDLWAEEFHLGRADLREAEQIIYDQINQEQLRNTEESSNITQALSRVGIFRDTAEPRAETELPAQEQPSGARHQLFPVTFEHFFKTPC